MHSNLGKRISRQTKATRPSSYPNPNITTASNVSDTPARQGRSRPTSQQRPAGPACRPLTDARDQHHFVHDANAPPCLHDLVSEGLRSVKKCFGRASIAAKNARLANPKLKNARTPLFPFTAFAPK